ncbi:hypothetical protein [Ktedonobacter racemifer]|uniref:hypothetical protein n=1 Tax=Ktedonobacter racemifer TaxID=363277 RepID=UPI0012FA2AA7|nr:hypothetical protein [Ktedonobacter racemifer]
MRLHSQTPSPPTTTNSDQPYHHLTPRLSRFSRLHPPATSCQFLPRYDYRQETPHGGPPNRLLLPCHPSSLLPLSGNLVSTPNLQNDTHWQPGATFPYYDYRK